MSSTRRSAAPVAWGAEGYSWAEDFTGDGLTDIVSASGINVSIAVSTGSGFVVKRGSISGVWGDPAYTWAYDFNRDGKTDIATARGCDVTVKISDGEGNFIDDPAHRFELPLVERPRCHWLLDESGQSDGRYEPYEEVGTGAYQSPNVRDFRNPDARTYFACD